MSELRVDRSEVLSERCVEFELPIDVNEIIDLSGYDFEENDRWLYLPTQCSTESTVRDLDTWLRSEPELIIQGNEGIKKQVDTRTFTRPKKRSGKLSFESIMEALKPPLPTNTWAVHNSMSNVEEQQRNKTAMMCDNKYESVPHMLKPIGSRISNVLYDESSRPSGQESMEAFLNMSKSNGIDSFINLTEPDFVDPLMSVSQPSILNSSILSLTRDSIMPMSNDDSAFNLDTTMNFSMQFDKSGEESEGNSLNIINETVLMGDITLLDNKSYCVRRKDETHNIDSASDAIDLNETYDMQDVDEHLPSCKINQGNSTATLPSVLINEASFKIGQAQSGQKAEDPLDKTYQFPQSDVVQQSNTVLLGNGYESTPRANTTVIMNNAQNLDVTVNIANVQDLNNTLDLTFNMSSAVSKQSTPICNTVLISADETAKMTNQPLQTFDNALNSTFKAPTSLRKELLAEIQRSKKYSPDATYNCISNEKNLPQDSKENFDTTYNHNPQNNANIPVTNKYNTYRKDTLKAQVKNRNQQKNLNTEMNERFYTFTKKSKESSVEEKKDIEVVDSAEKVDTTFCRPPPKPQRKGLHPPRALSRLPQFLQKSNPNLASNSLKVANVSAKTNSTFSKDLDSNITKEFQGTNKLHFVQKIKSGSEHRLLEMNKNMSDLCMAESGSIESISSIQSIHSAPDLDERLSICSDNSQNSRLTMNIEQLHEIVRMQEESLKQETTVPTGKTPVQRTWSEEKDLPSPILKNGVERHENDGSVGIDCNVKTSSPLPSSDGSSQSLNNVAKTVDYGGQGHREGFPKKPEAMNLPCSKPESKTRLRQPTNYSGGSRPSSAVSGIPRPASRIPAPKFVKQNAKAASGDSKKGFL